VSDMSWEDAVRWYRAQPGNEQAIRDNFFDLPVKDAAKRFAVGEEFAELVRLLGPGERKYLLDLGAGNGISAYAFAQHGWQVSALEPDPSEEVGAGAIRGLAEAGLSIDVVPEWGEKLPFDDASFDVVHARQVLHHANDLAQMVAETFRVLKPGGRAIYTREHVVDDDRQLAAFLRDHPLQHLYGGEHAYSVPQYLGAMQQAGFNLLGTWGPFDSIINYFPGTEIERHAHITHKMARRWLGLGRLIANSADDRKAFMTRLRESDRTPGRLFSFFVEKPCAS